MPNTPKHPLPGSNEHLKPGKDDAEIVTNTSNSHTVARAIPARSRRRTKPPEDVDSDYAEEAEDFFYGEGM